MTDVSVLGTGLMGTAIARALLAEGSRVSVWNRTAAKTQPLIAEGAAGEESAADAVSASPLTIVMVSDYEAVRRVLDGLPDTGLPEGHVVLSFTQAEGAINHLRGQIGAEPLTLAQTGDEGDLDTTILNELGSRGWSFAPAFEREGDPMHDSAAPSPPPADREQPEWERMAHEEAADWRIAVVLPDSGERYVSTPFFAPEAPVTVGR